MFGVSFLFGFLLPFFFFGSCRRRLGYPLESVWRHLLIGKNTPKKNK